MASKIVIAGSSNTDMILQMDHIPIPGETILGGRFSMAAGGKGANQAVAAARAGGEVAFLARVGDDLFGRQAIEGFERDGIDTQHVTCDNKAPSGVALIFVADSGENSIGVASGANGALSPADVDTAKPCIESSNILVMQLETPLETVHHAAQVASAAGVPVILNPAPAQPLPDSLLRCVSILTPNESEAEQLTGIPVTDFLSATQAAEALRAKGVETIIITMGAQGAVMVGPKFQGAMPAFPIEPVDTTAAGDVFNGALAVAWSEGKPLTDTVRFACAAAALSATKLGAQPSAPTRQEIEQLLMSK
ncbi:MAG: ribokinase [Planctomycetes bacterium]|nr:ribokinase [Planctomycetota bacterium]